MINTVNPQTKGLNGIIEIPADKSISHRSSIFSALTHNKSLIKNYSHGEDCLSTLNVLRSLGVEAEFKNEKELIINSPKKFTKPQTILDAGNSGTTIRLMSGVLASQDFESTITGDQSLQKRPMKRVITPLEMMGAKILSNNNKAPLTICGTMLHPIDYNYEIASAQVKSCVLLAGMHACDGPTSFTEPFKSRDHTEKMLSYMNADISTNGNTVSINPCHPEPKTLVIPGDISSAAFFMAAAAIVPNSDIILKNINLNPTRTGIVDVMKQMGAEIEILDYRLECNEEVGDLRIQYSELKGITIEKDIIPRLIDELPIIAVLATQAAGTTTVKDAQDLRNKESDRIKTICSELTKFNAKIKETPDGFIIEGKTKLTPSGMLECYHDHRLAMSMYVAGLIADKPSQINEFQWVNTSFPEFEALMERIRV